MNNPSIFQLWLSRSGAVSRLAAAAMRIAAPHAVTTARGSTVQPGADEQTLKVKILFAVG